MSESGQPAGELPVLTEVLDLEPGPTGPGAQEQLVRVLPGLLREALSQVQPELEQQLLDALMPRLLAALAGESSAEPDRPGANGPRLP